MDKLICEQCGGNHYITKHKATHVLHEYKGENFHRYEKVTASCPSCTKLEPIGLQQVWKDFNKVFFNDHAEPNELRKKGLI